MENRKDFRSILPYLPLILRSSAVFWPPSVGEALKSLSKGPSHSNVNSGQVFALAVSDLRSALGEHSLLSSASLGFSVFFDDLVTKDESMKWFKEVVPRLAELLLRLPELLETHYQNAGAFGGIETGLRLLESQQSGIVVLNQMAALIWNLWVYVYFQELIAALLVCALFCLFPTTNKGVKHLPPINFDSLFACLYECYDVNQEHKIKCLVHYFETICLDMPLGNVSFERKVLPFKTGSHIAYPEPDFWSYSTVSLCQLEVHSSGLIEDHSVEALEVDFANKYIGGGALSRGCVQEEIRFMINPELIISMLFLPSIADNEAIEIVGAQRFSNYSGYAKSFRFCGPHEDKKSADSMGRRKTRIIAIDALCSPGRRQYRPDCLLREVNKAFVGFLDMSPSSPPNNPDECEAKIGVATGNWGCGAFGGDPEIKAMIQWLAASQALRPFVLYYSFSLEALRKLGVVVRWILRHGWSVGDLWGVMVEYSTQRANEETRVGFFKWLLPFLNDDDYDDDDPMFLDSPADAI